MNTPQAAFTIDLNLMIVVGFLLVTMFIGLWAGRNVKTLKDYAIANREFGAGVLTMTFLATQIDGGRLLGFPHYYAKNGIVQLISGIGIMLAPIFFSLFIAPGLVHFRNAITGGDLAQQLFGKHARFIYAISGAIFSIYAVTAQVIVLGKMCNTLLGIPTDKAIIINSALILIYGTKGGVRSITITDVLQFIAFALFMAVIANVLVAEIGGFKTMMDKLFISHPQCFQIKSHPLFFSKILTGFVNSLGIFFLAPPYIQRLLMASNKTKIRKVFFTTAAFNGMLSILIMIIGFGSLVLFPDIKGEDIVPNIIYKLFPVGFQGLIMAGILAVSMSSADSFLNAGGITLTHDIIQPLLRKYKIEVNELSFVRYVIFTMSLFALALAFITYKLELDIFRMLFYTNMLMSGCFIPFIAGIRGLKTDKTSFSIALLTSIAILLPAKLFYTVTREVRLLSVVANGIAFFLSHYIINKGFVTVDRSNGVSRTWSLSLKKLLQLAEEKYFPTPANIAKYSETKVNQHGETAFTFCVFLTITYMLPYILDHKENIYFFSHIAIIRSIGLGLCCGLMLKSIWSRKVQRKYYPLYWHFTLLYCLPFSATLIFLMGAGSCSWIADLSIAIILLIVLVDWLTFLIISGLGITAAIACYYLCFGAFPTIPDFDTAYYLVITCISTTIIGLTFARRKEIFASIRFKTVTTLARFMGHEVNHLANYTVGPAQNIQLHLKYHAKPMTKDSKEGFFIETPSYNECFTSAKRIEQGSFMMTETAKQLAAIIRQYSESLNNPINVSLRALAKDAIEGYPGESDQKERIRLQTKENFFAAVPKRALIFVLHNIIRNAFVHGRKEDLQVVVTVDNHQLSIKDNGVGIPTENLERIFDMFFTTGDQRVSTGIGLGFAKLVVEWFNGKIWCESSQKEGSSYTEFIIEFPSMNSAETDSQMGGIIEYETKIQIAKKMLRENLNSKIVQKATGLSEDIIADLKDI